MHLSVTVGSYEFRNVKLKDSEQGGLHHNNLALFFCIMLMVFETMNLDIHKFISIQRNKKVPSRFLLIVNCKYATSELN